MDLQAEFRKFFNTIKLGRFEEEADLRDRRDILVTALQNALKDEKIPGTEQKLKFETFHQGSYEMDTAVRPKNNDYDIDLGVMFDVSLEEYNSSSLKKLVRDKLNIGNRTVTWKTPCITVNYINDAYHVDLAIYAKNNDDIHIAWGKEHATEQVWYKADPKGLTQWVSNVSSDKDKSAQFRRCVRYLKKWKEKNFVSSGNYAPPSIGLTIQARKAFDHYISLVQSDLSALTIIASQIKNAFILGDYDTDINDYKRKISISLPVEPYKNVYYKMTDLQQNNFYEKVLALEEALVDAKNETSASKTSKILRKIFGDEFPLVEDVKESNVAPVIISGNNA